MRRETFYVKKYIKKSLMLLCLAMLVVIGGCGKERVVEADEIKRQDVKMQF